MAEPENLVLTLLREMRAEMNARFEAADKRFDGIERRLDMMHRNGEKALARVHRPSRDGRAHDGELRG